MQISPSFIFGLPQNDTMRVNNISCSLNQVVLHPLQEVKVQKKKKIPYLDYPCLSWEIARSSAKLNCAKAHKAS